MPADTPCDILTCCNEQVIHLEFTAFDVEEGVDCSYDNVTVFNGENISMRPLATLCGSSIPRPITSSESAMVVRFKSDASATAGGFSIKYTTLAAASPGPPSPGSASPGSASPGPPSPGSPSPGSPSPGPPSPGPPSPGPGKCSHRL